MRKVSRVGINAAEVWRDRTANQPESSGAGKWGRSNGNSCADICSERKLATRRHRMTAMLMGSTSAPVAACSLLEPSQTILDRWATTEEEFSVSGGVT